MEKIKRERPNYLVIGIFMFIGIIAIILGVVVSDKLIYKIKGGYPLYLRFNEIDGLTIGSKINIGSGKSIGQVEKITLDGATLVVTVLIEKKYKINTDAIFNIYATSLVGGKYLAVDNFTGLAPYLKPGTSIEGKPPLSINKIISMMGNLFSISEVEGGIAGDIGGIFSSVNTTADVVKSIISDNRENINLTISNIAQSSKHLNNITDNLDRKLSSISDQDFKILIKNLQSSIKTFDILLQDINSPNAPLSILKDPTINHSLRTIITNLEETTERVKAKPSLLLRS